MHRHAIYLLLLLYFLQMIDRSSNGMHSANRLKEENKLLEEHSVASLRGSSVTDRRKPKELLCIRHGVSVANEFIGNRWGSPSFRDDPNLVDAPLSEAGMQLTKTKLPEQLLQQETLRSFLMGTANETITGNDNGVELVLISPLTRCLQTYVYGVEPVLSKLFHAQNKERINDSVTDDRNNQHDSDTSGSELPIPVLAHPLLRERVYTISDTGRPLSVLENEFPSIDFSECYKSRPNIQQQQQGRDESEHDDGVWWYTGEETVVDEDGTKHSRNTEYDEWRPHGHGQWYAVPGEPETIFEKRMEELKEWLLERKETEILMVTHWGVLRYLSDGIKWKNSEAKILKLYPSSS